MKLSSKQIHYSILVIALCAALFSGGCGNKKSEEAAANTATETTTNTATEATTNTAAEATTNTAAETSANTATEATTNTATEAAATEKASESASEGTAELPSYSAKELQALDNTSLNWGQGVNFNSKNQPEGSLDYQKKYGSYGANFIGSDTDDKVIWLTMDEGYENGYTEKILDVLKEKDCKVVFFITGPYAEQNPELIKRMISEGHVIGNHSWSHPSDGMPSMSIEDQIADITKLHNYVKEHYDYEMTLFRNPAGIFSEQSLAVTQSLGYRSMFWSFAHADWDPDDQPDQTQSLEKLVKRLHPGALYLLHAVSATNTAILGDFIDQARSQGYTFELP